MKTYHPFVALAFNVMALIVVVSWLRQAPSPLWPLWLTPLVISSAAAVYAWRTGHVVASKVAVLVPILAIVTTGLAGRWSFMR
ncbi:MAG TPA: hypothetical protein VNJ02_18485 [Vicinamibacterales bacterium]|nr:hypothetical protein [Vicinamibacterales bacterium]